MKYIFTLIILFMFLGCASSQEKVHEFFQTDNATRIQDDYKKLIKLLSQYKEKLDLRNPQNYNQKFAYYMYKEFTDSTNYLFLTSHENYIKDYKIYLKLAFQEDTKFRNDYLILGIYKPIWEAYKKSESHQITTLSYDTDKLKTLYYTLQVVKWKINTKKDNNDNYLFLTWQNNWQIELKHKIKNGEKPSWKLIENLEYIKNKKESLYSQSNPNFDILMSKMIYLVENSLKILGKEPLDVSIEVMKSLIFFM